MTMVLVQPPEVETLAPLTKQESKRLKECEEAIERGLNTFYEVGNALAEIRDARLYRIAYATFEDYCQEKWGMSRRRGYELIAAAAVVDNVRNSAQTIPANEAQANELSKLDAIAQDAVWKIAVGTADKNGYDQPVVTAAHIKSVVSVLTEVVKAGGLDDGSGEVKPLGRLIDAAITEETYERMMRQKQYIRDKIDGDEGDRGGEPKPRQKPDRSEVEALYDPEIQGRLARYIAMITEFENMQWPVELRYLLRMFQMHKAHANFQKARNLDDDCEAALNILKRLTPDVKLGITLAAQEHYDWLFDLGYCMSKSEYTARLRYMSRDDVRMALLTDAGEDGKLEAARGKLPGIVTLPWTKVWKNSKRICEQCDSAFDPSGKEKICNDCRDEAAAS